MKYHSTGLAHKEEIELSLDEAEKHHQVEILIDKPAPTDKVTFFIKHSYSLSACQG